MQNVERGQFDHLLDPFQAKVISAIHQCVKAAGLSIEAEPHGLWPTKKKEATALRMANIVLSGDRRPIRFC